MFTKSLNSILSQFTQIQQDLNKFIAEQDRKIEQRVKKIGALQADNATARNQVARAQRVFDRLEELMD